MYIFTWQMIWHRKCNTWHKIDSQFIIWLRTAWQFRIINYSETKWWQKKHKHSTEIHRCSVSLVYKYMQTRKICTYVFLSLCQNAGHNGNIKQQIKTAFLKHFREIKFNFLEKTLCEPLFTSATVFLKKQHANVACKLFFSC